MSVLSFLKRVARALAGREDVDRIPKGWLNAEEDSFVPPRSLWIGPKDPISHYYRWIWEYLAYLTLLANLRRDSVVLELGCGHGRLARGLLSYLRSPGAYVGLDVDRRRLADAIGRIEKRFPNFRFIWADVYNRDYNPQGATRASEYRFPFDAATFDVVFAASLYTHLLPAETRRYFEETARVLKPGGVCLVSFFLLDHYQGRGTTTSPLYEFFHTLPDLPEVAVRDLNAPDAMIGYKTSYVTALAREAGLTVQRVLPGWWSNEPHWAVNEQDLILLTRDGQMQGSR